ncbi:MAG: HEAT repeat domain-containing protein [Armatimonadetes bacterium]|nr:HEAT repeat domain-containing protein [Armatimonadota bacterium]
MSRRGMCAGNGAVVAMALTAVLAPAITGCPDATSQRTEELVRQLGSNNIDDLKSARQELMLMGDEAVLALIAGLRDKKANVRAESASTLSLIGDERAASPLINALSDPNENVRREAAIALGSLGVQEAVEPLIQLLREGGGERSSVAQGLGWLRDVRAVLPLLDCLSSDDRSLRHLAAFALGEIGDRRALDALDRMALSEPEPGARLAAEKAVEMIRSERAIPDSR